MESTKTLVEVAALTSAPLSAGPSRKELDAWIRSLPEKEKNDLLVTAASEPGERWKTELLWRFQRQTTPRVSSEAVAIQPRTVADLLAAAHARTEERTKRVEAQRAVEAIRRKAKEEASRAQYLDQLGKREGEAWNQVAAHILKRQPNEYNRAVALITDLRDLALRQGSIAAFQSALEKLRREHAAKGSFLHRLENAKL